MGVLKVMSREHGDRPLNWDKGKKDEVDAARRDFDFLVREKGYHALTKAGDRVREFDPSLEEVILVPQVVGG